MKQKTEMITDSLVDGKRNTVSDTLEEIIQRQMNRKREIIK
jgi:hypothetical protein